MRGTPSVVRNVFAAARASPHQRKLKIKHHQLFVSFIKKRIDAPAREPDGSKLVSMSHVCVFLSFRPLVPIFVHATFDLPRTVTHIVTVESAHYANKFGTGLSVGKPCLDFSVSRCETRHPWRTQKGHTAAAICQRYLLASTPIVRRASPVKPKDEQGAARSRT